ncbi:MAG: DUF1800 domain-containing protein [Phycisphaerales bacterium]|nr:MAG: DUF1800 domain-containing protein [Phycisphaerales bacterium]
MAVQVDKLKDPSWAWAAYEPDAARPWNLARAGHLYRRAAFGASWEQLKQALSDGPQRTIDKLLRPQSEAAEFNRTFDEYEAATGSVDQLRAWWLRRMIQTPHPLQEKMTLFWHGHFATNAAEVKNARLMQQHVRLLRSQALGSFRILLEGISQDPAVLIWLGAEANRKARPNENLARAIMETFTLGPDQCTENDIRDAARAFTGWFVLRSKLRYIAREHDNSEKQILGRNGNFARDDVTRIILEQPATSRRLVRKLYRWLISETEQPDEALISPSAESFAKDYDVLKLVETMLRSNLFFSTAAYRRRIKSPAEFAIGIVNALDGTVSTTQLAEDLAELGQNLYYPPTVKGWAGGQHWINSTAIVARQNLASALLRGSGPYGNKLNPWVVAQRHGCATSKSARQFLLNLFLQGDLDSYVNDALPKTLRVQDDDLGGQTRSFAYAIVILPEFNLA